MIVESILDGAYKCTSIACTLRVSDLFARDKHYDEQTIRTTRKICSYLYYTTGRAKYMFAQKRCAILRVLSVMTLFLIVFRFCDYLSSTLVKNTLVIHLFLLIEKISFFKKEFGSNNNYLRGEKWIWWKICGLMRNNFWCRPIPPTLFPQAAGRFEFSKNCNF